MCFVVAVVVVRLNGCGAAACMHDHDEQEARSLWPSSKLRSPAWLWTQPGQNISGTNVFIRSPRPWKCYRIFSEPYMGAPPTPRRAPRAAHFKQARPPRLPLQPAAGRQSLAWFLFVLLCCCFVLLFCLNRDQQTETQRQVARRYHGMFYKFDLFYSMSGFAG